MSGRRLPTTKNVDLRLIDDPDNMDELGLPIDDQETDMSAADRAAVRHAASLRQNNEVQATTSRQKALERSYDLEALAIAAEFEAAIDSKEEIWGLDISPLEDLDTSEIAKINYNESSRRGEHRHLRNRWRRDDAAENDHPERGTAKRRDAITSNGRIATHRSNGRS